MNKISNLKFLQNIHVNTHKELNWGLQKLARLQCHVQNKYMKYEVVTVVTRNLVLPSSG